MSYIPHHVNSSVIPLNSATLEKIISECNMFSIGDIGITKAHENSFTMCMALDKLELVTHSGEETLVINGKSYELALHVAKWNLIYHEHIWGYPAGATRPFLIPAVDKYVLTSKNNMLGVTFMGSVSLDAKTNS